MSSRKKPELVFVGTPAVPSVCPRERCGQLVTIHGTADQKAPITWSCPVGHGGVVNSRPEVRESPQTIPKGICQRCGTAPVPEKRRRGGFRGGYCDSCVEEGRRLFAEETTT
jgi:hypothetical protein